MLTQVILQSSEPMTLNIDNADPSEILILKGISGLTPQDVTNFTGDFARDGGYYQGRRTGARYPVFRFKMNPNYAEDIEVSDIRELLYRTFYEPQADSDGLTVRLVDDRKPDRFLTVYAEKWDGDIFEQSTDAQISTMCVDAYIQSVNETSASNPGGWLTVPINYDGSADAGIQIEIKVIATTNVVMVENNGVWMLLDGSLGDGPFQPGDLISISTVEGNRYVRLNGDDKMVLLDSQSTWLKLKAPANILKVHGPLDGDGKAVATSYSYRSVWRGV